MKRDWVGILSWINIVFMSFLVLFLSVMCGIIVEAETHWIEPRHDPVDCVCKSDGYRLSL